MTELVPNFWEWIVARCQRVIDGGLRFDVTVKVYWSGIESTVRKRVPAMIGRVSTSSIKADRSCTSPRRTVARAVIPLPLLLLTSSWHHPQAAAPVTLWYVPPQSCADLTANRRH